MSATQMRLGDYMSQTRFEAITSAIRYTDQAAPPYKDGFWEVRRLIDEWNANMDENFLPAWVSCLDESMSKWLNEFTCPGFMCVPRKPWLFGNEYHTIACGLTRILYRMEIVEGKDEPRQRAPKEFSEMGKTVSLLLRLTKPLWHTAKLVILDSGFCVLKGIVELRKKGVFASALIKKRRYWPKYIRGDDVKAHFDSRKVGDSDAWPGTYDGVKFHVSAMKEPDYVMSLMTTYGTVERMGDARPRAYEVDGAKRCKTVRYPEVVFNHFLYRDAVDANNGMRMFPIALEETWKTVRWPNRVFQFLLAVTETNCKLALSHIYSGPERSQQEFRKLFAQALIENEFFEQESTLRTSPRMRQADQQHELVSL